jgi:multiple sugar transport system substrate-binding protein
MRFPTSVVAALSAAALFAACGGDDEPTGGGGGSAPAAEEGPQINAKVADPASAQNARGEITYCIGGSLDGHRQVIRDFNRESDVTARLIALPESADEQRQQQIQRLRAKSTDCDVVAMDVIWTAEYASQGWLLDLTQAINQRRQEFIPSTLASATYQDKVWGAPVNSNAGFLYYRTDAVDQAPRTWQEVYEQAAQEDGVVYQGARYEGLTVNFLELLYSAGGRVLNEEGTESTIDSQQARDVLSFMRQGIENGASNRAVTTYMEEEARRNFESERSTFMRNWPYAYDLANEAGLRGKFEIATFPAFGQGQGAGVLGGYNLAINGATDNPGGALAFVQYYSGQEAQKTLMTEAALPATLTATYEDPEVQEAIPFAEDLREAITQAQPRPVSPVYPQISQAIYENVHDALTGKTPPDQAITQMNEQITQALATF